MAEQRRVGQRPVATVTTMVLTVVRDVGAAVDVEPVTARDENTVASRATEVAVRVEEAMGHTAATAAQPKATVPQATVRVTEAMGATAGMESRR